MTALIVAFTGVAVVWATGLAYGGIDRRCRWERRHKRRYQGSHRAAAAPKPWARRSPRQPQQPGQPRVPAG